VKKRGDGAGMGRREAKKKKERERREEVLQNVSVSALSDGGKEEKGWCWEATTKRKSHISKITWHCI
jgi:hypothetical protein